MVKGIGVKRKLINVRGVVSTRRIKNLKTFNKHYVKTKKGFKPTLEWGEKLRQRNEPAAEGRQNVNVSLTLYIDYKKHNIKLDLKSSVILTKKQYKEKEDIMHWMYVVMKNHIHGDSAHGLRAILDNNTTEDMITQGLEVTKTNMKPRGFKWSRFLLNERDYTSETNIGLGYKEDDEDAE
jgi:hypothetical protein